MLKSMTGYGRSEMTVGGRHIIFEIKSVNHKYFEFNSRISRGYLFLEDKLKAYLQGKLSRGKVDVFLQIETLEDADAQVQVNHSLAAGYYAALQELRERYSISEWQANTIAASLLMPVPVMRKALRKFNGGKRLPVYGETVFHPREKVILQKMAASLGVSFTALVIRLRGLGMLNHHSLCDYIEQELHFGGDTS